MTEATAITIQIIKEHTQITPQIQDAQNAINDLEAELQLKSAKEVVAPGRLDNQRQYLLKLKDTMDNIDSGLQTHFEREETALLKSFEEHGNRKVSTALQSLLHEHQEIRNRFAKSKADVSELINQDMSREVWEGKAWGMRIYVNHTLHMLKAHAQSEYDLFMSIKDELGI